MREINAGVYKIRNVISGRAYVGRAVDIQKRWNQHRHHLRAGNHHSRPLQHSWKKHGEAAFEFQILEITSLDEEVLMAREEYYMALHSSSVSLGGYNLAPSGRSNRGVKYSDESRARMSKAQVGRTFTDEAKAQIAATLTGRKALPETIEKRRLKITGLKRSPEQVIVIRAALRAIRSTPKHAAFGQEMTLRDWAEKYEINAGTLSNRIKRGGMSLEEALTCGNIKGARRDL